MERALAQYVSPELLGRTPKMSWVRFSEIIGEQCRQRLSIIYGRSPNVHGTSFAA
jgi:hypothetical protein